MVLVAVRKPSRAEPAMAVAAVVAVPVEAPAMTVAEAEAGGAYQRRQQSASRTTTSARNSRRRPLPSPVEPRRTTGETWGEVELQAWDLLRWCSVVEACCIGCAGPASVGGP